MRSLVLRQWAPLGWKCLGILCLSLLCCTSAQVPNAWAQTDEGHPSSGDFQARQSEVGASGGGAMADFGPLMNLIQQTIDPDTWLDAGGTSSMIQYPAGVFVDPSGQMQRTRATDATLQFPSNAFSDASAPRHPWRTTSSQRIISLKRLDEALNRARRQGLPPSAEMRQLAGLSRIDAVKIDVANEDVLLAGPANDSAVGFMLEDLAVVAASIKSDTVPLGCSIDPSDAGLLAAQQLLNQRGSLERLARNPKAFVAQLQEKIGAHHVRVFGLDPKTGTALAMIDADEHMKRVGFGLERTDVGIKSYFDHMERQQRPASQSLVRWWFAYTDAPIRVSPRENFFQLPEQCVRVMSEQQFVSKQGRAATGGQDPAADAFAMDISEQMNSLRASHPSYARLCSVFETALALQLVLESTGQPSLTAWFPNLCGAGAPEAPGESVAPQTVAGLTTWHKLKNGTVVAVVSGGVTMDFHAAAAQSNWRHSDSPTAAMTSTPPKIRSSAHEQWWW